MNWNLGKDIAEFILTVGTAIGVCFRILIKAKLKEQNVNAELFTIKKEIERLSEDKLDRALQEAENKRIYEELKDVRLDLKESSRLMSASIEKMAESVNKLEGTVHTYLELFANKKI